MKIINNKYYTIIALAVLLIVAGNAWSYSVPSDSSEWGQYEEGSVDSSGDSDSGYTWASNSMSDADNDLFAHDGGVNFSDWNYGMMSDGDSDSDSDTDSDYFDADSDYFDADSDYFDADSDSGSDGNAPTVPLPAPLLLLGSGLLGLAGFARRSRKTSLLE